MAKNKNFEKLLKAQAAIVTALADGTVSNLAGLSFEKARQAVGPIGLVKLDESFRSHLCGYSLSKPWFGYLSRPKDVDRLMADHPWLAKAAIHARDGHLRQKAVLGLLEPEKDPLDLAALLCRCNDPVPEVRCAAIKRWKQICQLPRVDGLADLLPILLERVPHWRRGGAEALHLVEQRPDYRRLLETMFLNSTNGPLAKRLKFALRTPELDDALGVLAVSAQSCFVRAVATQVVLQGVTRWQIGCTWQWVDKTISLRRRIPKWETRPVNIAAELRQKVLRAALRDPSVGVRKLAVDHLIIVGPDGFDGELRQLRSDTKYPIKWRMDYFERKWSGETSDIEK